MTCQCGTKITLVGNATAGDSFINPFGAEWLIAVNKFHDWKCIRTADGDNIYIDTTIEIGDGITPTYFRDYGHNFIFSGIHRFVLNPPAYLEIGGAATWSVTEKNQIRDALGISGDKIPAVGGQLQNISDDLTFVRDEAGGKWELIDDQMIFYKENGTELMRFNLFDENGDPTMLGAFRRERV